MQIITKEFIELGIANSTLNKAQCKILELDFPLNENWEELIIDKELTLKETNLFLFLRGKLAIKAQEQIIKNYDLVANFHKQKKEVSKKDMPIKKDKPTTSKDNKKILEIYCDGACEGNPGKAGSGLAIYYLNDKPTLLYGQYTHRGTNNTAELNALHKALLIASEHPKSIIRTDSMYSLDCISNWAYGWKKKGWTRKGKEIKNLEIIKISHALYDSIKDKVTIKHVKAHAGFEGNELADRMAGLTIREKNDEYCEYQYDSIDEVLKMREDIV